MQEEKESVTSQLVWESFFSIMFSMYRVPGTSLQFTSTQAYSISFITGW